MHRRVGTWTFDLCTRVVMKASNDGTSGSSTGNLDREGVAGGEGGQTEGAIWITSVVFWAM